MTQGQYIISRKVNIFELGRTLGNISEACRKLGVSRQPKGLRLKRLEKWAAENAGILTEAQVQALEEAKEEKEVHNCERTNQGRYCQGRTPIETFADGLALYQKFVFESPAEETEVMVS